MRLAPDCCEDSPDMTINIQDALQRMKKIKDKISSRNCQANWQEIGMRTYTHLPTAQPPLQMKVTVTSGVENK
ncbi:hypothetical protein NC653_027436 [Populus alba x Populus x berolinensis]|uniref:Uncharacterized protein n=1 Tax=Populus alba x Populus x berolinensis TaxID=444605 RepID=A0AAD6Q526_9ROSI|nr:hypothetical protein NC653_027436 [Populus alba x Populus x berolinensis]